MSEISKARERLLNQRGQPQSIHPQQSNVTTSQPRKFTVSSLTQKFDRPNDPSPSPSNVLSRQQTQSRPLDSPLGNKTQWSHLSKSKENSQPMLKTVNIKIHEMSRLTSQPSENELSWPESRYLQSPPRVAYRRTLHKAKPQLIAAPLLSRKHQSPFKPRECLKQWVQGVMNEARALGRSFVDEYFPPSRTILVSRKILCQQDNLKFERLFRIYQECEVGLLQSCEPTYLSPGKYTNPYLFSAFTILAQNPERVLALFGTQQFSEEGAYHVCLCKEGVWRFIVVDDFVPIKSIAGRKQMLSIHSKQAEGKVQIWPILVEKALAKVYGTYVDLMMSKEEGMVDLFKLLTGAPASIYELNKDFRSFLILVDSALKRGHIVTLEGANSQETETARLRNLNTYQAYKVLDIKKSGLKIRNYAQPQLVSKLAFDECLLFSRLVIYRIEPSYRYITQKLRHKKNHYSKVSLRVSSTTRAYFDIWQNNIAYYKRYMGSNIEYEVSRFKMWLSKGEEGEWVEAAKEIQLEKGDYELSIHLCQSKEFDFTFSYYGEKEIGIERIRCGEEWSQSCICNSQ